jgi:hypothetical protein
VVVRREDSMKARFALIVTVAAALLALAATPAVAGSTQGTFLLVMEAPNFGRAPNGDRVVVTGDGSFSVHPKSVQAAGEFTHLDPAGKVLGSGTWTATELLSFNFYGCRFIPAEGVDLGDDNLCGGAVKMRVVLDTPTGQFQAIMTVFCIVGPKAPTSHNDLSEEGVTLNVPGVINFNHADRGENIWVRVS